jgi:hypothetical protein
MILGPHRFQAMHQLQYWDMIVRINVVTSCITLCVKGFVHVYQQSSGVFQPFPNKGPISQYTLPRGPIITTDYILGYTI